MVLDRVATPRGELCLRRHGEHLEIISNGVFLMSTDGGCSERVLVDEALASTPRARDLVIGGLGVGHSLARACEADHLRSITVLELEPVVADWHRRHVAPMLGQPLDDDRVHLEIDDVGDWLRRPGPRVDAVCLDVDNGPGWTVHENNAGLYDAVALRRWHDRLTPGGVLAVWSAHAAPGFLRDLEERFTEVRTTRVPAPRGEADHVYLAVRGG